MTEQEFALRAQDQRGRLYRTAFLYLGGEHAAVDAVDEAVYRAFRDRRKLRQPEFFETWLTRILINVCKDELRRRRRECRVCVPPEPEAEHMDALSLREAVRALPEELRSVIVLRYFTGLTLEEITPELFRCFDRFQIVEKCWRKVEGQWVVKDVVFTERWGEEDYRFLCQCLQNTVATGGQVWGAFLEGRLKGFASVEGSLIGSQKQYADLTSIHVSADARGHGLGRQLFRRAEDTARQLGAEALYISAHSAVESQAFYKAMGCVEATEYIPAHVEQEPCDCQLECRL